jgi:hypothetical protein
VIAALSLTLVLSLLTPYGGGSALYGHTDPRAAHCYRAAQVKVSEAGAATITATRKARTCRGKRTAWDSGFLGSRESGLYLPLYGTIRVRATIPPKAPGIWPALWLRHRNGASTGEVDLFEGFGASPDAASQTLHFPRSAGTSVWGRGIRTLGPGPHTFWARIVPEGSGVRFTLGVDGRTTGTYRLADASGLRRVDPRRAWDVAANIAVSSGRWTGDHRRARASTYRMTVHRVWWSR